MLYNESLINTLRDTLKGNQHTVSVAESVTAGHIQAALSVARKASDFFQGGITVYNAGQKCRHLNIEPIYALKEDCVTEKVAGQMALNVEKMFLSDFGLAITGYAVKVPEKEVNDLFAYCAISFRQQIVLVKKLTSNAEEGFDAQVDYANQLIGVFHDALLKNYDLKMV